MCFFFGLVPGTLFLALAFFVFRSLSGAEGAIRGLGRALAIWLLVVASFFPVCGLYVTNPVAAR